jgi:predicted porin
MNKKLLAVAVAGALAAPGVALAQVTISGLFKVGIENLSYGNPAAAVTQANQGTATAVPSLTGRVNDGQIRIVDNSSRIIFGLNEDLGGGLAGIAQLDVRFAPDQPSGIQASNPFGTGNTWVGLRSNSWGAITMGRWDLHYGKQPDEIASKAGALEAWSTALMDYMQYGNASAAASNNTAIANATRTNNVIKWDSPNWSGFTITAAYSTNPIGASDLDMLNQQTTSTASATAQTSCVTVSTASSMAPGSGTVTSNLAGGCAAPKSNRKGSGYNINPAFTAANWQLGLSYWNAKADAPSASQATADQDSFVGYGYLVFGGFKIGLAGNQSKLKDVVSGADVAKRTAYTFPIRYATGAHTFYAHYTEAQKDKVLTGDTKATMYALAYNYDLSKRTSVGITYAKIDNGANSAYNFFTSSGLGSTDATALGGEDPTLIQLTMRHAF